MLRFKFLDLSQCLIHVYGPNPSKKHPEFAEETSDGLRRVKLINSRSFSESYWEQC